MSTPRAVTPTRRQADLLRFVAGYQAHHGFTPCYSEIAAGLGCSSKGTIKYAITRLEERGLIRRMPQRERSLELLAPIAIPRAPDGAPLYFVEPRR